MIGSTLTLETLFLSLFFFFWFSPSNLDARSHISSDIRGDGYPSFAISRVVVA